MTLLTKETILFLEEEGFCPASPCGIFSYFFKNLTSNISIRVTEFSVFLCVKSPLCSEVCHYYFDGIEDHEMTKLLVKQLQINPEKLITSYRSLVFHFLNEKEKFLSKSGFWNSSEFNFDPFDCDFVDENRITISFDIGKGFYSDESGFSIYSKMPF